MSPPVWYVASVVVLVAIACYRLGRASRAIDAFQQGYQLGRADRLEHELAAGDALRAVTLTVAPPDFVDAVARGWWP